MASWHPCPKNGIWNLEFGIWNFAPQVVCCGRLGRAIDSEKDPMRLSQSQNPHPGKVTVFRLLRFIPPEAHNFFIGICELLRLLCVSIQIRAAAVLRIEETLLLFGNYTIQNKLVYLLNSMHMKESIV